MIHRVSNVRIQKTETKKPKNSWIMNFPWDVFNSTILIWNSEDLIRYWSSNFYANQNMWGNLSHVFLALVQTISNFLIDQFHEEERWKITEYERKKSKTTKSSRRWKFLPLFSPANFLSARFHSPPPVNRIAVGMRLFVYEIRNDPIGSFACTLQHNLLPTSEWRCCMQPASARDPVIPPGGLKRGENLLGK